MLTPSAAHRSTSRAISSGVTGRAGSGRLFGTIPVSARLMINGTSGHFA